MSKLSENSKYLSLEDARVYYNEKSGNIEITVKDEDVLENTAGGFIIRLSETSAQGKALKDTLHKKQSLHESNALPQKVDHPLTFHPGLEIALGVNSKGEEVIWDLDVEAHNLVTGGTGRGKSVLQRTILAHCLQPENDFDVYLMDFKKTEFKGLLESSSIKKIEGLSESSGIKKIARTFEEATEMLEEIEEERRRRYALMKHGEIPSYKDIINPSTLKPIMVIIDESYHLFKPTSYHFGYKDDMKKESQRQRIVDIIINIARFGRAVGIHFSVATQDISHVPLAIRDILGFIVHMDKNAKTSGKGSTYSINTKLSQQFQSYYIAPNKLKNLFAPSLIILDTQSNDFYDSWEIRNDSSDSHRAPSMVVAEHPGKGKSRQDNNGYQDHTIVFGERGGSKVFWNLKRNPQCVISGLPGAGKTELARNIVKHCVDRNINVRVVDGKNFFWENYADLAPKYEEDRIIERCENTSDVLNILEYEMARRRKLVSDTGFAPDVLPRIVYVFDDPIFLSWESQEHRIKYYDIKKEFLNLATLSAEYNMHCVIIHQNPQEKYFENSLDINMGMSIPYCNNEGDSAYYSVNSSKCIGTGKGNASTPENPDGIAFEAYYVPRQR